MSGYYSRYMMDKVDYDVNTANVGVCLTRTRGALIFALPETRTITIIPPHPAFIIVLYIM